MEYIDFFDEKYRSYYEWAKTTTNNFDSSSILLNIERVINHTIYKKKIICSFKKIYHIT